MYKIGDRVKYGPNKYKAKIVKVFGNGDYLIEFDNGDLIPPQMEVSGIHLVIYKPSEDIDDMADTHRHSSYNNSINCPRCGNKWTETWIGHRPFYDCLKCNLKREDV